MKSLDELARERNTARKAVVDWMMAAGAHGDLRQNLQAPAWPDYERAERALEKAINAAGVNPATAD